MSGAGPGDAAPRAYDAVIGLGAWCGVSYNLRRYLRHARAYPFDWWVVGWEALCKLLDENFANLLRPENLRSIPERNTVACSHYGIDHPHDFLRAADGRLIEDIARQAAALREKFKALIDRMDGDAAHAEVLAVRDLIVDAGEIPAPGVAEQRAAALFDRLSRRWPTARLDLLVIGGWCPPHAVARGGGRMVFDTLDATGETDMWRPRAWDMLLQRQGVRLKPAAPR